MSQPSEDITALDDQTLRFPDGIPGSPDLERFLLVELVDDGAFQELQSVEDEGVSMIVCVPWLFFPDYGTELSDPEQQQLEIHGPEDAVVFCPVTFDSETKQVYVNLLGPFVVNARPRVGRQLILAGSEYITREAVQLAPT